MTNLEVPPLTLRFGRRLTRCPYRQAMIFSQAAVSNTSAPVWSMWKAPDILQKINELPFLFHQCRAGRPSL